MATVAAIPENISDHWIIRHASLPRQLVVLGVMSSIIWYAYGIVLPSLHFFKWGVLISSSLPFFISLVAAFALQRLFAHMSGQLLLSLMRALMRILPGDQKPEYYEGYTWKTLVSKLLGMGASLEVKDTEGNTPLSLLCGAPQHLWTLKAELLKQLQVSGALVNHKNHQGQTALDRARDAEDWFCVQQLLTHYKATWDSHDSEKYLWGAYRSDNVKLIEYLVQKQKTWTWDTVVTYEGVQYKLGDFAVAQTEVEPGGTIVRLLECLLTSSGGCVQCIPSENDRARLLFNLLSCRDAGLRLLKLLRDSLTLQGMNTVFNAGTNRDSTLLLCALQSNRPLAFVETLCNAGAKQMLGYAYISLGYKTIEQYRTDHYGALDQIAQMIRKWTRQDSGGSASV